MGWQETKIDDPRYDQIPYKEEGFGFDLPGLQRAYYESYPTLAYLPHLGLNTSEPLGRANKA